MVSRLLVSTLSLVFALACFEVFVYLFLPAQVKTDLSVLPKFYFLADSTKAPRDYHYKKGKQEGVYRIAVIGDSFTYPTKMQLYDTYSKRLEWMLNLRTPDTPRVEVLNYGMPGKGTEHYTFTVPKVIEDYAPDLVIIETTLNDPDTIPYRIRFAEHGKHLAEQRNSWVYRNSVTYRLVFDYIQTVKHTSELEDYYRRLFFNEKSWNSWRANYEKITESCELAKTRCVSLTLPLFGFGRGDYYRLQDIHERIGAYHNQKGTENLDLSVVLTTLNEELLVIDKGTDLHPNERAHRIISEELASWLLASGLIPRELAPDMATTVSLPIRAKHLKSVEVENPLFKRLAFAEKAH